MKSSFSVKIQLSTVKFLTEWLNFWSAVFQKVLFRKLKTSPRNILIYRAGGIGDIVCAVPTFIAIRRFYPESKITLLTSPGKIGAIGAKELLNDAWFFDEIKVYYVEDIDSWDKKVNFFNNFRKKRYDLFIQLIGDTASFWWLLRNMVFALIIGAKSVLGFKIGTVYMFKKAQFDWLSDKTEVERLIDFLKEGGIAIREIEFDLPVSVEKKKRVERFLENKWSKIMDDGKLIIAINPGGKFKTNHWPVERFAKLAKYLQNKYEVKIVVVGGKNDVPAAEIIKAGLDKKNVLSAAGELDILETFELLKHCSFLISNNTGTIHLAAAAGTPVVVFYGVRDAFGRWFPYGKNHKILCHRFLNCDYKEEGCIKKSIEAITIEETIGASEQLIKQIYELPR